MAQQIRRRVGQVLFQQRGASTLCGPATVVILPEFLGRYS
jgi:hypothetical protein